jgi:hypothetical protein
MKPKRILQMPELALVAALLFSSIAGASEFRCPPSIDTKQSSVAPVKGFEPWIDTLNGRQLLERVSIYDGHPREGADLVPDNAGEKGDPYWTNDQSTRSLVCA